MKESFISLSDAIINVNKTTSLNLPKILSTDDMEYYEERAAILEYEAGFSREEAEMRALEYLLLKQHALLKAS